MKSYRPRPATVPSSLGSVEMVRCGKEELSSEVASTEVLLAGGCGLRSPSTTDTGVTVETSPSFLVWGFTWFLLKNTGLNEKQQHQALAIFNRENSDRGQWTGAACTIYASMEWHLVSKLFSGSGLTLTESKIHFQTLYMLRIRVILFDAIIKSSQMFTHWPGRYFVPKNIVSLLLREFHFLLKAQ